MDFNMVIELKRKPFSERIAFFDDFLKNEIKNKTIMGMLGRTGIPPVDTEQDYLDPVTKESRRVVMFGSNSYLGLANEAEIKKSVIAAIEKFGLGNGGSPAFSGYTNVQSDLEKRLAALSGHEDAIITAGGYIANLSWITGLINSDDVIIYDKSSHASTLDAMQMTNIMHKYPFNSSRPETLKAAVEAAIRKYPGSDIFISVEGVRSVDGSVTDIPSLLQIIEKYRDRIFFMLDDAHGLGTIGKKGYGTLEYHDIMGKVDLRMSTCSKAMGIQGAFITGSRKVLNYIRSMANSYTFTTSMSQPVLAAISAGLDFMHNHPERIAQIHINKKYLQDNIEALGYKIAKNPAGIIPVYITGELCEKINRDLFDNGIFANVFHYPLISPGKERIRLSMMATHKQEHLDKLLAVLKMIGRKYHLI